MQREYKSTHQKTILSLDSLALLMYCSELSGYQEILTRSEWNELEKSVRYSKIRKVSFLLTLSYEQLMHDLEIKQEIAYRIDSMNKYLPNLIGKLQELELQGIFVTTKYEEMYPLLLKKKMKKDAPLFLYYCGDIHLINTTMVGIAGPSRSNHRIDQNTKRVVEKIYEEDYTLIAGINRGVDKTAIRHQLKLGGKVVNFSSSDFMASMKEHQRAIKNGQLLLVSEQGPTQHFDAYQAMITNQYMFSLSECMIIMYSQVNSGGIWLSAMQNFKEKWTRLIAIMDDEFYGNGRLVELGAIGLTMEMIESPLTFTDLLEQIEEEIVEEDPYDQLSIFDFLGAKNESRV